MRACLVHGAHGPVAVHVRVPHPPNGAIRACAAAHASADPDLRELALELFQTRDGSLLANEMAPRVHNSGHWTMDGAVTSQFENHLRAVQGLPLGSTQAIGPTCMVNVIGQEGDNPALLAIPHTHLHRYDKAERAGRKLAHVNVVAASHAELLEKVRACQALLPGAPAVEWSFADSL